jgi:hypothetical protein
MFISEITFSLGNSMPLEVITRHPDDRYASVKPHASAKVCFDPHECDPETEAGQALINQAFDNLFGIVLSKVVQFKHEFEEFAKPT